MTKLGNMYRRMHSMISERPTNFSWVVQDKLSGSGLPVSRREFGWLLRHGIKSIVTVREIPLPSGWTKGVNYLHLRVDDYDAPSLEELDRTVNFIDTQITNERPVNVHCAAGRGRTGLILAAYLLKKENLDAEEAVDKIRHLRPGSIQSEVQEVAITMYEKYLKNKENGSLEAVRTESHNTGDS